jgi:hypothetical protein
MVVLRFRWHHDQPISLRIVSAWNPMVGTTVVGVYLWRGWVMWVLLGCTLPCFVFFYCSAWDLSSTLSYYWFWTPEGYSWNKPAHDSGPWDLAIGDMLAAHAVWNSSDYAFNLATAGWTLGLVTVRSASGLCVLLQMTGCDCCVLLLVFG